MKIDNIIEELNKIKSQYGNVTCYIDLEYRLIKIKSIVAEASAASILSTARLKNSVVFRYDINIEKNYEDF